MPEAFSHLTARTCNRYADLNSYAVRLLLCKVNSVGKFHKGNCHCHCVTVHVTSLNITAKIAHVFVAGIGQSVMKMVRDIFIYKQVPP